MANVTSMMRRYISYVVWRLVWGASDAKVERFQQLIIFSSKPLALHTISFGNEAYSSVLKRMATIAKEVYETAPVDESLHIGPTPCNYHTALDTVSYASLM